MVLSAIGAVAPAVFVVVAQFRGPMSIGLGILSLLLAGGNFIVLGRMLLFWSGRNTPAPTWLW